MFFVYYHYGSCNEGSCNYGLVQCPDLQHAEDTARDIIQNNLGEYPTCTILEGKEVKTLAYDIFHGHMTSYPLPDKNG